MSSANFLQSIFERFSVNKFWKVMVDANRWKDNPEAHEYMFDKGFPYYTRNMYRAFYFLFSNLDREFDFDDLVHLYHIVMFAEAPFWRRLIQKFTNPIYFVIGYITTAMRSFYHYLTKKIVGILTFGVVHLKDIFFSYPPLNPEEYEILHEESIRAMCFNLKKELRTKDGLAEIISDVNNGFLRLYKTSYSFETDLITGPELNPDFLMQLENLFLFSSYKHNHQIVRRCCELIATCKEKLMEIGNSVDDPVKTKQIKKIIAKTIKSCCRLHPFRAGNGRVFAFIFLNYLLLQSNRLLGTKFSLCILRNPGGICHYSTEEFCHEIEEGMQIFADLCTELDSTTDIMEYLQSKCEGPPSSSLANALKFRDRFMLDQVLKGRKKLTDYENKIIAKFLPIVYSKEFLEFCFDLLKPFIKKLIPGLLNEALHFENHYLANLLLTYLEAIPKPELFFENLWWLPYDIDEKYYNRIIPLLFLPDNNLAKGVDIHLLHFLTLNLIKKNLFSHIKFLIARLPLSTIITLFTVPRYYVMNLMQYVVALGTKKLLEFLVQTIGKALVKQAMEKRIVYRDLMEEEKIKFKSIKNNLCGLNLAILNTAIGKNAYQALLLQAETLPVNEEEVQPGPSSPSLSFSLLERLHHSSSDPALSLREGSSRKLTDEEESAPLLVVNGPGNR